MEDKIFDLITKMYSEFTDFRKEVNGKFDEVNGKFDEVNGKFDEVNGKLDRKADKTDIVRLENLLADKTNILFDGYMQVSEQLKGNEVLLESLNHKVDNLSIRMTSQESKFEVLVGGKKSR